MGTTRHGTVSVEAPDLVTPPERAGRMTPEDVHRTEKTRPGIGLVADDCADAIEKLGAKFMLPPGVTAAALRTAGERSELVDRVLQDLRLVADRYAQANLLFDAETQAMLRALNDQVKAQAKSNPELLIAFQSLMNYFAKKKAPKAETPA